MSEAPNSAGYTGPEPTPAAKQMAMIILILNGFCCLGSLILWLVKKAEHPYIDFHGKEAINWIITMLIIIIPLNILSFVISPYIGYIGSLVGLAGLVLSILGGLQAGKGQAYRYPFALRLIK